MESICPGFKFFGMSGIQMAFESPLYSDLKKELILLYKLEISPYFNRWTGSERIFKWLFHWDSELQEPTILELAYLDMPHIQISRMN